MIKKFLILLLLIFTPCAMAKDIEYIHKDPNIHTFVLDGKKLEGKIKPYVAFDLDTVKNVYEKCGFSFVVNGGFFDPLTKAPASFVVIDGNTVESPYENESLVSKFSVEDMDKIAHRAEFRVLENAKGALSYDIAYHSEPPKKGWSIKHSLQAGPMLLPCMDLEREHFVSWENDKLVRDSIDCLKRRARTVLGIKGDDIYIVIFEKQGAVTMDEARQYCKKMGLDKAMAFDGGGSTAVSFLDVEIFSQEQTARKVKSFLVVTSEQDESVVEKDEKKKTFRRIK